MSPAKPGSKSEAPFPNFATTSFRYPNSPSNPQASFNCLLLIKARGSECQTADADLPCVQRLQPYAASITVAHILSPSTILPSLPLGFQGVLR